ncbi:type III-A CRISPR-associated RAMP protein Csm5 [Leptotrichia sp. oral taxon 417]|jgi:CRISPR-associated RAMP protein, csm5 family|uniref:type III-A CRISPR-associated RAMP protein Csm5 n=1 Tax=Leptotrichia TaxID=32067 RepID=UPI0015C07A44|nr:MULTISPECIES: type III-A CRISPR-associated RAMP protein Csm5 [Leptotrichia]NWO27214.1 type III-A CRISPR-associated RAMP protein Csm5 [Leptotrichia sp. oral taxon 417]
MNVAKKYNVKLIPLTDIYIGSGKDIEAYEYTVKDKYMYRIDMSEVFDKMNDSEKENFYKILQENNFFNIRSWIYNNYKEKWGYIYKEKVSSDFEKYYKEKLDDKSQENSQLSISEFIGYNNKKYIPGSSIKGALRTAFIYSDFLENEKKYEIKSSYEIKNGKRVYNRKEIDKEAKIMESEVLLAEKEDRYGNKKGEKLGLEPKKDPFKTVKIFDTEEIELEKFSVNVLQIKEGNLFCEVLNGTYNEIKKTKKVNFEKGINFNIILTEYSLKDNSMMDYKKNLGIKKLLDSLDDKMENILNFEIEKEREKDSYNLRSFYEFLKKIFNSFKNKNISLVRIGKYTGFNDKTINLLTTNPSENSRTILDENNYPMGWVLIKVEEVDI